jgi:hypothetical protein
MPPETELEETNYPPVVPTRLNGQIVVSIPLWRSNAHPLLLLFYASGHGSIYISWWQDERLSTDGAWMGVIPQIHEIIQSTFEVETVGTVVGIVRPYDFIAFAVGIQANDTNRRGNTTSIVVGRTAPPYAPMLCLCNVPMVRLGTCFVHKIIRCQSLQSCFKNPVRI